MDSTDRPDFTDHIDLAAERLGGAVLAANDEFFAPKEALLKPGPAEWREGEYTERGKWMDGWETRRRRSPGHDWCVVRLGLRGVVRGVDVDTSFFRGNYPEHCAIEACTVSGTPPASAFERGELHWDEILPKSALRGDSHNLFAIDAGRAYTHLRLTIFPDGGVARFRVYGEARPDWKRLARRGEVELAGIEQGGYVLACSDMFFGHRQNLIMPGRSTHMGDGWETKRRRGPGHDWSIVRLGAPGRIRRVEIDTDHFKGNAPGSFLLESCASPGATVAELVDGTWPWETLVARTPLQPHSRHVLEEGDDELAALGTMSHVRLSIFPDGGVARLRVYGSPDVEALA